jgi:small GTP-binding protein
MSSKNPKNEKVFKLLVIGDFAVGKSSLISRYVNNKFEINIMGTAGLDLKKKVITINDEQVKICIFDTAGQERFRYIAKNQINNADGILIIYDVTDRKSFNGAIKWLESIKKEKNDDLKIINNYIIMIGNKIDLNQNIQVNKEEASKIAENFNVSFFETSAKDNINVQESFEKIIYDLYNKAKEEEKKEKEKEENEKKNNYYNNNKREKPEGCCSYVAS